MGSLEIPLCLHEELGPQIYPDTNHRKQKSILLRQINSNCNQKKKNLSQESNTTEFTCPNWKGEHVDCSLRLLEDTDDDDDE